VSAAAAFALCPSASTLRLQILDARGAPVLLDLSDLINLSRPTISFCSPMIWSARPSAFFESMRGILTISS